MGKQRIRRRRRGFRKPDAVIGTLTFLTILLVVVWGGLHWKESSSTHLALIGGEQPSATGETDTSISKPITNKGINEGIADLLETVEPPTSEMVAKPETQSPEKSQSPSTAETNAPHSIETNAPSDTEIDSPISHEEKYEQEMILVQVSCTKGMKEVLVGAESRFKQLDRTDPVAIQAWRVKLMKELSVEEGKCDGKFQELAQNAENNAVPVEVIEEWQQTFTALKEELHHESDTMLRQLIGA